MRRILLALGLCFATLPAYASSGGSICDWLNIGICATVDNNNNLHVINAPASSTNGTITAVVSGAAESNHVIKASPAAFYDAYVTTGATGGYLLIINSATDPGNGAVTPIHCVQAPANVTVGYSVDGMPAEKFSTGVVVVFSTTGCFTETKSATAFFHVRVN